jgi:hypothetical protein
MAAIAATEKRMFDNGLCGTVRSTAMDVSVKGTQKEWMGLCCVAGDVKGLNFRGIGGLYGSTQDES